MKVIPVPSKKYTPFMVRFPGGQRRFFKTEDDATTAIREHKQGKAKVVLGKRLVDEVLYIKELLGEVSLLTAARFYLEHHKSVTGKATLGEACDLYWSSVNTETASPYYTAKVRQHLNNLKKALKIETPLTEIGALRYQDFIKGLPTLPQQHAHHRTCRGLFGHAVAHSLMAKNPTHTSTKRRDDWAPAEMPKKRPVFLTAEATALLLDWTALRCPRLLPAFVLQLFCGVRSAELARVDLTHKRPLHWSDIDFDRRIIDIPAEVSKTNERRVIDWTPPILWEWLRPFRQKHGRVCCDDYDHLKSKKIKECTAELKLDGLKLGFGQNAFRHSFATYAVAHFQSAERVALLMGHRGSDMLFLAWNDSQAPGGWDVSAHGRPPVVFMAHRSALPLGASFPSPDLVGTWEEARAIVDAFNPRPTRAGAFLGGVGQTVAPSFVSLS